MNETLDNLFTRRSVRAYIEKTIPDDAISNLLKAAMSAPSANNQKAWHFIVVKDRGILGSLAALHSWYGMLEKASAAIIVCFNPEIATLPYYLEHDCSAATQNILIAAQSLKIGSVWLGITNSVSAERESICNILNIPDHITPFSIVSLGYPREAKVPSDRFDENKIHYNFW